MRGGGLFELDDDDDYNDGDGDGDDDEDEYNYNEDDWSKEVSERSEAKRSGTYVVEHTRDEVREMKCYSIRHK